MEWVRSRVETVEWVGPSDFILTLRTGGVFQQARPGQFAMLRPSAWTSDPLLPRPLSILSVEGDLVSFLVRVAGRGTRLLSQVGPGDEMTLLGPLGEAFPQPESDEQWVLVAGGVGIAPLLMWAERHRDRRATLYYGARSARDLLLLDRALACTNLELATEDGTAGSKGLVTELLARLDGTREKTVVLTCGPWPMMERVAQLAGERSWRCFASLEARMACGRGICLGCSVPTRNGDFVTVCRQGPVFDAQIIDWTRRGG